MTQLFTFVRIKLSAKTNFSPGWDRSHKTTNQLFGFKRSNIY